jgi:serine/threonine protein kinase
VYVLEFVPPNSRCAVTDALFFLLSFLLQASILYYNVPSFDLLNSTLSKTYASGVSVFQGFFPTSNGTATLSKSVIVGQFTLYGITPTVSDSSFSNPNPTPDLGGCLGVYLALRHPELRITNSVFSDCHSSNFGGALYVGDSTLAVVVLNTVFRNCSSVDFGGAIYAHNIALGFTVNSTTFQENRIRSVSGRFADLSGSTLYLTTTELTMFNTSVVSSSFAERVPGAAVAFTRGAYFNFVVFAGNAGGSVRIHAAGDNAVSARVSFNNSAFTSNEGYTDGSGGILVQRPGTNLTISNCLFTANTFLAANSSSAILINGDNVHANVYRTTFSGNIFGGGFDSTGAAVVLANPSSTLIVNNSTFDSNSSPKWSACIYVTGGSLELRGQGTRFSLSGGASDGVDVHITTQLGRSTFLLEAGIRFSQPTSIGDTYKRIKLTGNADMLPSVFTVVSDNSDADLTPLSIAIAHAVIDCSSVRCVFGSLQIANASFDAPTRPTFLLGPRGAQMLAELDMRGLTINFTSTTSSLSPLNFRSTLLVREASELIMSGVDAVVLGSLQAEEATLTLHRGSRVTTMGDFLIQKLSPLTIRSTETAAAPLPIFETKGNVMVKNGYIILDRVYFHVSTDGAVTSFNWTTDGSGGSYCLITPAFRLLAPEGEALPPTIVFDSEVSMFVFSEGQSPQRTESVRFIESYTGNSSAAFEATQLQHPTLQVTYEVSYERTATATFLLLITGGEEADNACGRRPDGPFFYCEVVGVRLVSWTGAGSRIYFDPSASRYELSRTATSTGAPFEILSGSSILLKEGIFLNTTVDKSSPDLSLCPVLPTDKSNPARIGFEFDLPFLVNVSANVWNVTLRNRALDIQQVCYEAVDRATNLGFLVFEPYIRDSVALEPWLNCSYPLRTRPLAFTNVFIMDCNPPADSPILGPLNLAPTIAGNVQSSSPAGAIAGGVVALVVVVIAILVAVYFFRKRKKPDSTARNSSEPTKEVELEQPVQAVAAAETTPSDPPTKRGTVIDPIPAVVATEIISIPGSIPLSDVTFMQDLGKGSWGIVSLAVYKGEFVAVKRIPDGATGAQLSTLMDEAKLMASIKAHRNLVKFIGICSDAKSVGLMMEFCPRGSLLDYMRGNKGATLPDYEILKYAYGVLEGMIALATTGLVHRDLAARNVLLDERMFSKVSDFGSSRRSNQADEEKVKADDTLGPIKWQPPEVLNDQSYSEKSDVWSFGCTLLEIVTRREPYAGYTGNILQLIQDIKDGRINPLMHLERAGGHDINTWPDWVVPTLRACFEENPSKRPSFREIRFRIAPKTRALIDQYEAELDEIDSVLSTQQYTSIPSKSNSNIHVRPESNEKNPSSEVIAGSGDLADLGSVERLGKLGEGSFGTVFLGKYKGQYVAIKVLNLTSESGQAVLREAEVMSLISQHRNIVQLFGLVKNNDHIDIVMEFAPKGSCEDYVASAKGKISEALLFKWALGIARGMAHLTASKVVHRDLSARNVLLDSSLEPKIADFGLGRTVLDPNQESSTQTDVGPLRWFAPECFDLKYSEKTDVWAYGCTLIELATGGLPFPSKSVMDVFMAVRDHGATPMDEVPSTLPRWLKDTMQKCFLRNAKERASFAELASFIETQADSIDEIREAEAAIQRRRNKRAGTLIV